MEPENAGKRWSKKEDKYLADRIKSRYTKGNLSFTLGRSQGAIVSRAHRYHDIHDLCSPMNCQYNATGTKRGKAYEPPTRIAEVKESPPKISLADEIKKLYPYPNQTKPSWDKGSNYSIPGALHLFVEKKFNGIALSQTKDTFPGVGTTVSDIMTLEPGVSHETASHYARKIHDKNKKGFFMDAWDTLKEALESAPKPLSVSEEIPSVWGETANMW